MKRKVLAIIMSLAIAVAFVPTFAFADAPEDQAAANQTQYEQIKDQTVAMVAQVNGLVQDLVKAVDLSAFSQQINDVADQAQAVVDAVVNGDGDIEAILQGYGEQLDALMQNGAFIVAATDDFYKGLNQDNPELVASALEGVVAAQEQLQEVLDAAQAGDTEALAEKAAAAVALMNGALDALEESTQATVADAVSAVAEAAVDWAEAVAKEGLSAEDFDAFMESAEAIGALVQEMAGMEPSEALAKAIDEAGAIIEANKDTIAAAAEKELEVLKEQLASGVFDEYLEQVGLDGESVAFIADILPDVIQNVDPEKLLESVVMTALSGESMTDLQEQIAELQGVQDQLNDKIKENEALLAAVATSEVDNGKLEAKVTELNKQVKAQKTKATKLNKTLAKIKKNCANAKKVKKAKLKLAKKQVSKKKKVTVKWKKNKKIQVTGYQIAWKVGKKWKYKKVSKKKLKAVTKKIPVKKAKKGKKAKKTYTTVKVRAYYVLNVYGVKTKCYSKWSKAKKVRVK